jgi:hypothetical protein
VYGDDTDVRVLQTALDGVMDDLVSRSKFTTQHSDGFAAEQHAIVSHFNPYEAAAPRRLIPNEGVFAEFGGPIRAERAVRGAGDRVFSDARRRCKEARDEIDTGLIAPRSDDDPACPHGRQAGDVRIDGAHLLCDLDFDEVVERVALNGERLHAERLDQASWRFGWSARFRRKVEHDPLVLPCRAEPPAPCFEEGLFIITQLSAFPEHVRTGQCRMPAEVNLDRWREPA